MLRSSKQCWMEAADQSIHLVIFFLDFCVFFLILLFEKSSGSNPPYEACISRRCEKGPSIRFPFYIDGLQESFCGLFKISCGSSGYPIYRLSENDYAIKQISYESQFFSAYNVAIDNFAENCLSEIRNVTPPAPSVGIASESRLHLLSRCGQSLPEQLILKYGVNCDAKNGDGVKLAMLENDSELNSAIQQCETNVVAPVELYGNEGRNGVVDYEGLLRRGFSLRWKSRNCTICEESGGRCGINTTTNGVRCFCSYGTEYASCQPTTSKSSRKHPEASP
ncbi:hypothetical protein M9H77_08389 [Catharanthus roseus]|uniref:Uncharacterized protein n=1 Tax=Catharanthus roseus TaxID=4058 RepID=A0ACC0BXT8_CATRO|nr:hypothetical protein M9H77_08389 [Catharanthus roseus]